jgi:hypothetical protein
VEASNVEKAKLGVASSTRALTDARSPLLASTVSASPVPATSISVKDSCCACTPSRHSDRHVMAEDESMGTDEDTMAKTMRRMVAINLDPAGNENCNAYFFWHLLLQIFL